MLSFIFATTRTYKQELPRFCLCCTLYHGSGNEHIIEYAKACIITEHRNLICVDVGYFRCHRTGPIQAKIALAALEYQVPPYGRTLLCALLLAHCVSPELPQFPAIARSCILVTWVRALLLQPRSHQMFVQAHSAAVRLV